MNERIDCERLVEVLSDYVDGELDESLCSVLEKHIAGCENCRVVVDTLRKTIQLYRETSPDVEVPPDVQERLYECLNLQDFLKKQP